MNSKGRKLLERAKNSPAGWRSNGLIKLYEQFGFEIRQGKNDINDIHPTYKNLRASISKSSGELSPAYTRHAVKMIEKLIEYKGEKNE
ncbi:MAG TPA: hypothetical protein G4N92_04335 [Anaerolineae bacterium]|nr:hypothetical protein [Anaerolineae bacterium]